MRSRRWSLLAASFLCLFTTSGTSVRLKSSTPAPTPHSGGAPTPLKYTRHAAAGSRLAVKEARERGAVTSHDELGDIAPSFSSVLEVNLLSGSPDNDSRPCALPLPPGCACSLLHAALSVRCARARLTSIPRSWPVDFGPALIRTLNLERNNLSVIKDGDFFGLKIERLILAHNRLQNLQFLAFWGLEYNLKALDLGYNRFARCPSDALRVLQNLRSLSLTANRITALREFEFGYMRKLEILVIDNNPIVEISASALSGTKLLLLSMAHVRACCGLDAFSANDTKHLRGLSLARNAISSINERWFANMKNLWYLNLADNHLKQLQTASAFRGLAESLRTLDLSGNRLDDVPSAALYKLRRLESLNLSRNRIRRLRKDAFNWSSSVALQTLNLSFNRIAKIHAKPFLSFGLSIRSIDLRGNRLSRLDDGAFTRANDTTRAVDVSVHLSGNRWLCNCMLKWMRELIRKQHLHNHQHHDHHQQQHQQKQERDYHQQQHQQSEASTSHSDRGRLLIADGATVECDRPQSVEGMTMLSVPARDFTCDNNYYYYYGDEVEYDD